MTPQYIAAATGSTIMAAQNWVDVLHLANAAFGINSRARQDAFLAQIGHESGGLQWVAEIWGPTPAQRGYEGRKDLGNTEPGDGSRFRGHGLIQVTGRGNHARMRDLLRKQFPSTPDFELDPRALEIPKWAALSAACFWAGAGCNVLADQAATDALFDRITRKINGGLNGREDRLARWHKAQGFAQ